MCKQALHKITLRNEGKIKNITQFENFTPKLSQKNSTYELNSSNQ